VIIAYDPDTELNGHWSVAMSAASPTSFPSKRRKTTHVSLDHLAWKPVLTHTVGRDFDDGLLELEEVDDVQVIYEQTANGRVATFLVRALSSISGSA
jgi:hypothetical protein